MASSGRQTVREDRRGIRLGSALALAASLVASAALPVHGAWATGPQPLNFSVSGANGVGSVNAPGQPCAEGGNGSYWHYDYGAPVAAGLFSSLASALHLHLDVHSQGTGAPQLHYANAFLMSAESVAALSNNRGTVRLSLRSQGDGTCASPTMAFDGTTVSGPGTWQLTSSDGAYRAASGNGTFQLGKAEVAPGAINAFQLRLNGTVTVLPTGLAVHVVNTFWGNLGLDYALRRVSVAYQITNTGPGDSFGSRLVTTTSSTNGVTPLGPTPQALGDLRSGQSATVTVKYQLGLFAPCQAVILNCKFSTTLNVSLPDALDVDTPLSASAPVQAPVLPPPL